jgi:hypothetical protein
LLRESAKFKGVVTVMGKFTMANHRLLVLFILISMLHDLFPQVVFAGQLGNFEQAAVQEKTDPEEQEKEEKRLQRLSSDESDSILGDLLGELFVHMLIYPATLTMYRMQDSEDPEFNFIELRRSGSPSLPIIRADFNYQRLSSNIDGIDGRLLAGYGPVGAQYRHTRFREKSPNDTLDIIYIHGLYRISLSDDFEIGPGFGAITIKGQRRNSGSSVTLPIGIYPYKRLGFNFTPTWSRIDETEVHEYDGSLSFVLRYFSLRLGYRHLKARKESLAGPYLGLSGHY